MSGTTLSDRELRILRDMLADDAWERVKADQDLIAQREGVTRERICQQASKLLRTIRDASMKGKP